MAESEYISVASLPPLEDTQMVIDDGELLYVDELSWDIDLLPPHVDTGRMFIDASRCRTMHKTGLFSGSHIAAYQGEVSEYSPSLMRMNSRGQIFPAISIMTKKAAIARGDIYTIDDSPDSATPHTLGTIAVLCANKAEIATRVADAIHEDHETSPTLLWGQELDVALRQAMRQAGSRHLMESGNSRIMRYAALCALTTVPGLIRAE